MVQQEYILDWVQRAQEIAHLGLWDQDPVSNKLWWSDETFRILGLEPQSIAPSFKKFLQAVHQDDRELIVKQTKLALNSNDHPYKVEYRIVRPDSSERIIYEEALIKRDENGSPLKITGIIKDITERKQAEAERERLIKDLKKALQEVKTLSGLLPICMHCKKIKDDKGYWNQIESYIQKHSDAEFSHSLCKECAKKYYPDFEIYDD